MRGDFKTLRLGLETICKFINTKMKTELEKTGKLSKEKQLSKRKSICERSRRKAKMKWWSQKKRNSKVLKATERLRKMTTRKKTLLDLQIRI